MIKVSPSILSADFANLESEMARLKDCGAHWAHVDVMDGHFVPNISFGAPIMKSIRNTSNLIFDVHICFVNELDAMLAQFAAITTVKFIFHFGT